MVPGSSCPAVCLSLTVMDAKAALMSWGLSPETFTRLSISKHLLAVSVAYRGDTLMNSEDWRSGGGQRQPNREQGLDQWGSAGLQSSVQQGSQERFQASLP